MLKTQRFMLLFTTILTSGAAGLASGNAHAQLRISTLQGLQAVNSNLAGNYILVADINSSATANWNSGAGFIPLGSATTPFTGIFNGNGHLVINLYIKSTVSTVGLFGQVGPGGVVQNIGLTGASVSAITTAYSSIGTLVGLNAGIVAGSYATGKAIGSDNLDDFTGGLVGVNRGSVLNSHSSVVASGAETGGLVGQNFGTISNSFASGAVTGGAGGYRGAGGLVGDNYDVVTQSYATGNVIGTYGRVGGLVGNNDYATISNSFATGSVKGLGTLANATFYVGGLVGENSQGAPSLITSSFSTGAVSGTPSYAIGGLVGYNNPGAKVSNSYWDTTTSGQTQSSGGAPDTTSQLQAKLPAGFSAVVWAILPGVSFPYLPAN